jgi:ribonucleoside-triphosphate reductase (formate)
MISKIEKRNGEVVDFDVQKIESAVYKALTFTKKGDKDEARVISDKVLEVLLQRFSREEVPTVEDIQNIVEEALIMEGFIDTARSYILYREKRREVRDAMTQLEDSSEIIEKYIDEIDWEVKENANMTYSLQGLNQHATSHISKKYWLNKIYPYEIREAAKNQDFHIHDLNLLATYCCGWDLQDLLLRGFGGVPSKIESKPPKHFRPALGQIVNFFFTLQGESAGAQAMSNFDTFLAPFIRYDNLDYKQVKQSLQEFLFNCMVPTRVGFQCLSEDTEILTKDGWKKHNEVKQGDVIKTFNTEEKIIQEKQVKKVFSKEYEGKMYSVSNRIQDQLISPHHRMVRKKFNSERYVLEEVEEVLKLKTPQTIPIAADNKNKAIDITNEEIKLVAWIVSEGSMESKVNWRRIVIYQSEKKNKEKYEEILALLEILGIKYTTQEGSKSLGDVVMQIRFNSEETQKILDLFDTKDSVKKIPSRFLEMSQKQSRVFLETYIKGDGHEGSKITVSDKETLRDLQRIIVNSGYGFTTSKRKSSGVGKKMLYIIRVIRHQETHITKIKEVDYKGFIWSVNTDNETVIAKRKGKVFITGNTPFLNVSLDVKIPEFLRNQPIIIGGEAKRETYGEFQKEVDIFNKAFYECLMEGDSKGRVFTFPIPTISIAKDFDWDNKALDPMWEATAKYGINYFSNFIQSDMKPEDFRSMCPLDRNEKVLIRSKRGRGLEYSSIGFICEGRAKENEYEVYSDGKFIKGRFNKFPNQKMMLVVLKNGHKIKMSENHLNYVMKDSKSAIETLKGKDLKEGFYLPYSLNVYEGEGGNKDLGYFVGAFAGDGSFDGDGSVVFSLEQERKKEIISKIIKISEKYFGAHYSTKKDPKTKLFTLKIHSRAAVGLCKDFIANKKREKHYKARIFGTSVEFRKGVLKGHYETDGGNKNRTYTSSKRMVESINMLNATLGKTTSIYKDDREGRLGSEPNYAVRAYSFANKKYGDIWFKKKEKVWVQIKLIKKINKISVAYCFEVENGEPVFTVGTTGILTHNCRLRLDNKELIKRGGGLFGSQPLTGSIGVCTINLPRIGYLSKTKDEFYSRLGAVMDLAKESLEIKRKAVDNFIEKGLYPYSKHYLNSVKKMRGSYFGNHFSTIGLIGMNESLLNFMGEGTGSEEGRKFAVEILDFMRDRLVEYQEKTGNLYNLEATPGEGCSYRQASIDRGRYPDIITAGTKENPYYTNSIHLPVGYTDDPFEALDLQDELQQKFTGGTVFHLFLGERMATAESAKGLVKKVLNNYHLPYITITPTFSVCPNCGYLKGEQFYCPNCKIKGPKKIIKNI